LEARIEELEQTNEELNKVLQDTRDIADEEAQRFEEEKIYYKNELRKSTSKELVLPSVN